MFRLFPAAHIKANLGNNLEGTVDVDTVNFCQIDKDRPLQRLFNTGRRPLVGV
ncbi:hypothetical protein [Desulfopila aestuarii]|uniref:hypothetical protein n=1 Tax=Desulfopila aestuarii TaxID=231440 RepID=UPI0013566F17|nr:hypothetical protein [Desulfopila aestuarii]